MTDVVLPTGGRPGADDPLSTRMAEVLDGATTRLRLMRDGDACEVAVDDEAVVVTWTPERGRVGYRLLPRGHLVGVLAELVELAPREPAPEQLRLGAVELAHVIARRGVPPAPLDPIASHWRIEARRPDGGRALEALEAGGGWWLVEREDAGVRLVPVRSDRLLHGLARLA